MAIERAASSDKKDSFPKRVVVLGARGFVGTALVGALAAAAVPVRAVSSSEVDLTAEGASAHLASLLEPGDAVVVNSAITPDKGRGRERAVFALNLKMGENLAEVFATSGGLLSQVIYISSDAVFSEDLPPIGEATPPTPGDLYGAMHHSRELLLSSVLTGSGVPFLRLRPCAIYGVGDTHGSYGPNRFLRSALSEGKIVLFGQGEERRPHLPMSDFLAILLASLRRRLDGTLHAIPGESPSFFEVAEMIATRLGGGVRIEFLERSSAVAPKHKWYDASGLATRLPEVAPLSLAEGMDRFVREGRT